MQSAEFQEYVKHGSRRVPGMLQRGSLITLWVALDAQSDLGVTGNLAEIGVYHGRLFTALALALRKGERAIGFDTFSFGTEGIEPNRDRVMATIKDHGGATEQCALHILNTQSIGQQEFARFTGGKNVRLFSVDGDHTKKGVRHDLNLVASVMRPDGIIVVDDLFNIAFPGVTEGILSFLENDTAEWVPFAISAQPAPVRSGAPKLFLAHKDHCESYRYYFRNLLPAHFVTNREFAGAKTIAFEFVGTVRRRQLTADLSQAIKGAIGATNLF